MKIAREGNRLVIDIHGMKAAEAKFRLEALIESCGADIESVTVIHGFHSGRALKDMVRGDLAAPRIKQIRAAYNAGQTVIDLRKKKDFGNRYRRRQRN